MKKLKCKIGLHDYNEGKVYRLKVPDSNVILYDDCGNVIRYKIQYCKHCGKKRIVNLSHYNCKFDVEAQILSSEQIK